MTLTEEARDYMRQMRNMDSGPSSLAFSAVRRIQCRETISLIERLLAEREKMVGALTDEPTSHEVQSACLAYGGSSGPTLIKDALVCFLAIRRAALLKEEG